MRILTGIQPSGIPHLGNYFGAMRQVCELQEKGESFLFIADYHAMTTNPDPETFRKNIVNLALDFIACGVDLDRTVFFRQSAVPEVCELAWILDTITPVGFMERAHSYKDKIAQGIKPVAGLFFYPVLMAADILLYQASLVPVGKDQVQHVEMTQDMATYFNEAFAKGSPVLRRPEWRLSKTPYVPGVDGRKMSKSYGNNLPLFESGKRLRKLCAKIVTDSTELGQPLPLRRRNGQGEEVHENVYALLELFCDEAELEEIRGYYRAGQRDGQPFGWGHAKMLLAEKIDQHFAEARQRREHFVAHPEEVEAVLRRSAERARAEARRTIDACKQACGLS